MTKLPQGWVECELGEIFLIERGGSPRPIKMFITDEDIGINWIKIGDTQKNSKYIYSTKEKIKPEGKKYSRTVNEGDLILSNSMSFGRPYIVRTCGCIHDGWVVFRNIYKCAIEDYLYYILSSQSIYNEFSKVATGSTVKNLNIDRIKHIEIKIPPLNEQKRIVEKIEKEFEKIDKGIENLEKVKEQIKQYRQSVLQSAFNGNLYQLRTGWQEFELKDVCKNISAGGDKPKIYSETETELCKIPIYSNGIQNNGLYGYTDVARIVEPAVTVSARGTIGFVCVRKQPYLPIVRLISVIPDTSILNIEFLKYFLNYVVPKGEGSSIPQLTVPNFKKYIITLPSLDEQQKIVEEIEKRFKIADEVEKNIDKNLEKAKQLKQSILKKAFEGRLIPQDPTDEPASKLLEMIKEKRNK